MKLNKLFKSNMVFAANKPVRIFGEGKGKASITFDGITKEITSDKEKWLVEFPSMEYGGPYEMCIDLNGEKTVIDNIYIGEVYLFAGQSNMQFKCKEAKKPQKDYNHGNMVRFYVCDRLESGDLYNSDSGWLECNDEVIKNISAVGYFTSCEVNIKKDVAIGGVCCYQGASVIETWVPKNTFKNVGIDIPVEKRTKSHVCEEYSAWNGDGTLYDFAFSSIVPFSFSAVVWYQGESDSAYEEAKVYADELATLIDIWRTDLNDENLSFIVVQLADYDNAYIDQKGWARIQEAQIEVCDLRNNVHYVVCRDVCEKDDIHPPTKDKLAMRIADVLTK